MLATARRVLLIAVLPVVCLWTTSIASSEPQVATQAPGGRGFLGAIVARVLPSGALVLLPSPGGPAERGGIRAGDVILEAGGTEVSNTDTLTEKILAATRPGETIHLKVVRLDRHIELDVVLGPERPRNPAEEREASLRGCTWKECPACLGDLGTLDNPANADCRACRQVRANSIAGCVLDDEQASAIRDAGLSESGTMVPTPASSPAVPPADPPVTSLVLHEVTLEPARVGPGDKFLINVSYASPSNAPVSFTFAISAGGRELFASKMEDIAGTSGSKTQYTRSVAAAREPGVYHIRVALSHGSQSAFRDVTLTVAR